MVIRLECPSTIVVLVLDSLLELRLSRNLCTLSVLSWVSWSHIDNRLRKLLIWRTTHELIGCLMWVSLKRPTSNKLWVRVLNSYILGLPTACRPDTIVILVGYLVRNGIAINNLTTLISVGYVARKCIVDYLWKLHTLSLRNILMSLTE